MVSLLIPLMVMLVFGIGTLYYVSGNLIETTLDTVKKDIQTIITPQLQDNTEPTRHTYRQIVEGIESYTRKFSMETKYQATILSSLLWVFGIGFFIVIIQIVLLTIYVSHTVAGPVFHLEKVCRKVIEGDYTQVIHLRRHDDMKNLAGLFNDLVRTSRDRLRMLMNTQSGPQREKVVKSLRL